MGTIPQGQLVIGGGKVRIAVPERSGSKPQLLCASPRYRFIRTRLLNRLQLPLGSRYTILTSGNKLEGSYCPKDIAVILSKLFAAGISWLNHTKSFQINHGKKVAN